MAVKTERQHQEERLASLKDKLAAELAKPKTDDEKVRDFKDSIEQVEKTLAANDPKLDKPYGFNWNAVS